MKAVAVVGILMLVACSSSAKPAASVTPTPSHQASSTPTPIVTPSPNQSPSPSSAPAVNLTALGRSLSCSLPVTWVAPDGVTKKAGFMKFPSASLVEDRSAPATTLFYDRAFRKWLPVWRTSVSPDGRRYAYGEGDVYQQKGGKVHVVDVSTGVDKVAYSYTGNIVYGVVDFAAEGIYLTRAVPEGRRHGLWLLDLAGGAPRLISASIASPAVGGGAAWGVDFNRADTHPAFGGLEGPVNRLLRFNLRSGSATPWFYRPGSDINIMGFDSAGNPLVSASLPVGNTGRQSVEVWLVKSATVATKLFAASGDAPGPQNVAAIDRHGVWLSSSGPTGSVWLYGGGSIRLVATLDSGDFHVAGGCFR
jgi:hypothetical protein